MASTIKPEQYQHVLVMRHDTCGGDGNTDRMWWTKVPKPWYPPLGWSRALEVGKKLRAKVGFPIHRIVTSPFRRCVETAQKLIAGLTTVDNDAARIVVSDGGNSADSSASRIKVSIDYGMCKMMNDVAMWYHPTDRNSWGFDIEELEALFPPGVVDFSPHRVFPELPQWGESKSEAEGRYLLTIHSLADRYPEENLLFVTHGEGVKVAASTYWKKARGQDLDPFYLGYVHLKRQIVQNGNSFTANSFRTAKSPNKTGIVLQGSDPHGLACAFAECFGASADLFDG